METVLIRLAAADEHELIAEVDVEAFTNSDYGRATGLQGSISSQNERRKQALRMFPGNPVFVAIQEEVIVGFVVIEGKRVYNIAVLPTHRNKGIGTALVERAIEAGVTSVYTAYEPAAIRMYEKAGFNRKTVQHSGYLLERNE